MGDRVARKQTGDAHDRSVHISRGRSRGSARAPTELVTGPLDGRIRGTVLVVDDDADSAAMIAESLRARGFRATSEADPKRAVADAMDQEIEVVLTDLQMRSLNGLALCGQIASARPELPVIVLTGHASIDAAIGAIRVGAFDFLTKPADPEILSLTVERAVQHHRLRTELRRLRTEVGDTRGFSRLLGESPAMRSVRDVIARVAPTQASVLITGESGTGKELVARAIHDRSPRASGPFVAINCAAIPASLLESELFGHAKGAFTDAKSSRRGLFLEAQGGTILLDEIGEMPLSMQVKLLRALQERTLRAVGGNAEVPFDARVIAATNLDLEREVVEKRFREDLYYRINVCSVEVPALRDREVDVPLLARSFVKRFATKHEKGVEGIAAAAMAKLVQYAWPGNVRELENMMERAVAMAQRDQVTLDDLSSKVRDHQPDRSTRLMPVTVEKLVTADELAYRYTKHVLTLVKGNKARAARILGFDRRTLYRTLARVEGGPGASVASPEVTADDDDADEGLATRSAVIERSTDELLATALAGPPSPAKTRAASASADGVAGTPAE
jgi:two-component system, NtrC family, response regulator HydG